ncbi:MAG: LytTR family transcriptional regulator DNA-binding domain-containing protein [Pseudomonadota bacterium]
MVERLKRWARPVAIIGGIGTFLAILGPFGSHAIGWPWVWVYWVGFIAFGAIFGFASGHLTPRFFPSWPTWAAYAVAACMVSIPVTLAVWGVNGLLSGMGFRLIDLPVTYFFALVISSFVTAIIYTLELLSSRRETAAPGIARPGAALLDKLPLRLRSAQIWALESEDHYLRVHTERGDALILMRLGDAITACEALNGAKVHRSWWVSREGVADARKGDGRGTLILKDGKQTPVSRTYYPDLRNAGWF